MQQIKDIKDFQLGKKYNITFKSGKTYPMIIITKDKKTALSDNGVFIDNKLLKETKVYESD